MKRHTLRLQLIQGETEAHRDAVSERLALAKRAYTTRRVPQAEMARLLSGEDITPRAGDLLLARVDKIGKHASLELTDGRRSSLFTGDEIILAYAARYAPDQFEAHVPDHFGPCQLVAGGGIAAEVACKHDAVAVATAITPIGLIADARGERINLARHGLPASASRSKRPITIASVGTSMNSGKTTSAAYLIRGLAHAGLRVGAAKVTGTGSGHDPWLMRDAGALRVLDFTDAGHASTHLLDCDALIEVMECLLGNLAEEPLDAIVIEVADGLFQCETAQLLASPQFRQNVDAVIFSSGDAMGAHAGSQWLQQNALPVSALCGTLTRSPLARREAAAATRLPVMCLAELSDPQAARTMLDAAAAGRTREAALA